MREMCQDASTRSPKGMADGDSTAVRVGDGAIEAKLLFTRQVLRRKRLVDLHYIDARQR